MARYIRRMKKSITSIFLFISLTFWSFTKPEIIPPNTNTWNIKIGDSLIMATWLHNKMGDTAVIDLKKFNSKDTIYAQRYLCGAFAEDEQCTLTIKNENGEVIGESKNTSNAWAYGVKMPLEEITNSNKFIKGQAMKVYFTIDFSGKAGVKTVLLCNLKFE